MRSRAETWHRSRPWQERDGTSKWVIKGNSLKKGPNKTVHVGLVSMMPMFSIRVPGFTSQLCYCFLLPVNTGSLRQQMLVQCDGSTDLCSQTGDPGGVLGYQLRLLAGTPTSQYQSACCKSWPHTDSSFLRMHAISSRWQHLPSQGTWTKFQLLAARWSSSGFWGHLGTKPSD